MRTRECVESLIRDERGAVAATYALALIGLVAIAGVGFDYAHMMGMQSELQNGADQAALAGATQLDGQTDACSRAATAAISLVNNSTLLADDNNKISIANETTCDATGNVRFWQDKARSTAATDDSNANFIELRVDERTADFSFTPIAGLLHSTLSAAAMAGVGSSVCKVPPIMVCSPDPTQPFDAAARVGDGIVATGKNSNSANQGGNAGSTTSNTWSPGDFGFLQINDPNNNANRNAQLLQALAYANPPLDCTPIDGNKVSTGNPQGLYDAINTRFDIYDFPSGSGNTLGSCQGTNCPPAPNVVKDLTTTNAQGNGCKINHSNGNGGTGWTFPAAGSEFKPIARAGDNNETSFDDNGKIALMGLPRDNCHYTSYNGTGHCSVDTTGRFGNGVWDRKDYFTVNHGGASWPSNWSTITRYDTYLWELDHTIPNGTTGMGGATGIQRGAPMCYAGTPSNGGPDRRVLTIAVVKNCAALAGASSPVDIDQWVDVFLVEPSIDDSIRYDSFTDSIYMEVIGPSKIAGTGTYASQAVRRDVPYLVR